MTPFDVTNAITSTPVYSYTDETATAYKPFLINRALSNYYDCIMHANEMNQRPVLSNKQQFDYYFYAIDSKKKRFAKWHKPDKDETVKLISEYYTCSINLAEQYAALLDESAITQIREKLNRGGRGSNKVYNSNK